MNKERLSQQLIILTNDQLKKGKQLITSTHKHLKKINIHRRTSLPRRSKSKLDHRQEQIEELLSRKIEGIYHTRTNSKTPNGNNKRKDKINGSGTNFRISTKDFPYKRINGYNLSGIGVTKHKQQSFHPFSNSCRSLLSNLADHHSADLITESGINSLNISNKNLTCYYPTKYTSARNDNAINLKNLIASIELDLDKRLLEASLSKGIEKLVKNLSAYKIAFSNIIGLNPESSNILERIKIGYEEFIKCLVQVQETEISEFEERKGGDVINIINKNERLDLRKPKIRLSEITDVKGGSSLIYSNNAIKKSKIPALNLGNVKNIKDYNEEFMDKEDEFSPSWREKLQKEKRF